MFVFKSEGVARTATVKQVVGHSRKRMDTSSILILQKECPMSDSGPVAQRTQSPLDKELGGFLKEVMKARGWSYQRLADETDIAVSMIHGIVSGEKCSSLPLVWRISKSLKVSLKDIFPNQLK